MHSELYSPSGDGVTVLSIPWGLVLCSPGGLFLLRTTVGNPSREIDPCFAFDLDVAPPVSRDEEDWLVADRVA